MPGKGDDVTMSMKVTFKYCSSEEAAEAQKWLLACRLDVPQSHV